MLGEPINQYQSIFCHVALDQVTGDVIAGCRGNVAPPTTQVECKRKVSRDITHSIHHLTRHLQKEKKKFPSLCKISWLPIRNIYDFPLQFCRATHLVSEVVVRLCVGAGVGSVLLASLGSSVEHVHGSMAARAPPPCRLEVTQLLFHLLRVFRARPDLATDPGVSPSPEGGAGRAAEALLLQREKKHACR